MKYSHNADKLLDYGTLKYEKNWPNYLELGFDDNDIPALLRLAQDWEKFEEEAEPLGSAPYHAWRVLGQLKAEAAILPLLNEIDDLGEWSCGEANRILGLIGEKAIEPIRAFIFDSGISEERQVIAVEGLGYMVENYPEQKERCKTIFVDYLKQANRPDSLTAGFVVSALIDMKATDQIELIRDVFNRGCADISIAGDLEDVEIALKLRKKRSTPKPRYHDFDIGDIPFFAQNTTTETKIKIGRNDPCPCGSGKKYKKCCLH